MAEHQNQFNSTVLDQVEGDIKRPSLYKVYFLNDDYTTQDFVVEVLVTIFHKQAVEATRIMLDIHKKGRGIAGIYPKDIAMTRVNQTNQLATQREFPLKCLVEEA